MIDPHDFSWYLSLIFHAIDTMFSHFEGLYGVFGFSILGLMTGAVSIIAVLRLLTNGNFSLSKTIDYPQPPDADKSKNLDSQYRRHLEEDNSRY